VTPSVPGVAIPDAVKTRLVTHAKSTLLDLGQSAAQLQPLQAGWAKAAL
jgi:hypothetical protein